ncbi:PDR/VanB family oxidoreductase [Streptomyces lancefieldiae]|uniref:PDR/VanB family oxidoreductase n=1 Tax=Streptomyces lancefieldiae TaxID=3075520 RepID=A0ABU3APQ3_9ACTN|nr:PDR/VanB family oxidoreductase [Streptomyces sp. DSM 40712]MDT0612157.1 PDR/VanB family oxidoreductase [Streptomyces sp. DSM 40712]
MTTTTSARTEVELDLHLERKETLADGVVRLTLNHPAGEPLPAWEPGAHIDLVLGPDLVRQYSLCGNPADRSVLQVAVLREAAGRGGSRHVHDALAEGDTVRVRGPRNHFALVDSPRYLFIAGGIGITPILPMIREAEQRGPDWRLVYGGRTRTTMAFAGQLARAHPGRVELCPQDETGHLDLQSLLGTPQQDTAVYCCGPGPLLDAVEKACADWPEGALHIERFVPKTREDDGPATGFEVELAQSGLTLPVPADRSILEVVQEAGVEVLSSCQEGTCGSCETAVLAGKPDHRDSLLSEKERAASDVMFLCVSRSHSRRLVLDL